MELPALFTRKTLAEFCGIAPRTLDQHIQRNTLKIKDAVEKIPNIGTRIKGSKARHFIQAMHAKRSAVAAE